MERTALPGVAEQDDVGRAAGSLRRVRSRLEPVAVRQLIAARWGEATAWVASFGAVWVFAGFALNRHARYQSVAYDFGFFDQIIWNTSQGRWFETSFVEYNFLGQHVEPVLLVFAAIYRFGGGPETLLVIQATFAGLAAVPLFYATRRLTAMPGVALAVALAYLLSPALHRALDFDLHPELLAPFFVFSGLYFLSAERPLVASVVVASVLLLKEDMAIVAVMFGALLWLSGWRRHGTALVCTAFVWGASTVFVLMPFVRGGGSDLNERFAYLFADTSLATVVPVAVWRGGSHLVAETLPGATQVLTSMGWVAVLSPTILLALPSAILNGLSDHPQQARLDLQYGVATLSLLYVATAIVVGDIAHRRGIARRLVPAHKSKSGAHVAAILLLVSATVSFALTSPYSPTTARHAPDKEHREAIQRALQEIPATAALSAQNTLLPHLSQREQIYEFPDVPPRVEWVIVDSELPITQQSRDAGYDRVLGELPAWDFSEVFSQDGVRIFSREVAP